MEIRGNIVTVTSSEADWIHRLHYWPEFLGLRQQFLDERRKRAATHLAAAGGSSGLGVREARSDIHKLIKLGEELREIRIAENADGIEPNGAERHIISVEMTPAEKRLMLYAARDAQESARENALELDPSSAPRPADATGLTGVTEADLKMGVALDRLGRTDPDYFDRLAATSFQGTLTEIAVAGGIAAAISADLGL